MGALQKSVLARRQGEAVGLKSFLESRNSTWEVSRTFLTAGAAAGTVGFSVLIPFVHVGRMTVLKTTEFSSSFSFFFTSP